MNRIRDQDIKTDIYGHNGVIVLNKLAKRSASANSCGNWRYGSESKSEPIWSSTQAVREQS